MKLNIDLRAAIDAETFEYATVCGADIAFNFGEGFLWQAVEREGFRRGVERGYEVALDAFEAIAANDVPRVAALTSAASLMVLYGLLAEGFHADNAPAKEDYFRAFAIVKHELYALLP